MSTSDQSIISANPFRCRMWEYHDRFEGDINEQTCREEISSFEKHGQLIPVLGRRTRYNPDHDIELIYGARRLFVARHLDMPLLIDVRDIPDNEAIVAMDIENRLRKDISPYERGRSFARFLHTGHFESQEELARALKISASQVSRLLKVARLPTVIVSAFEKPTDICEGWAQELTDVLDDPARRDKAIRVARQIASGSPRPSAREIYKHLITAGHGRRIALRARDEVVTGSDGQPLLRIRRQTRWIAILIPAQRATGDAIDCIGRAVADVLQSDRAINGGAVSSVEMERAASQF